MITQESVERLKASIDIVDVISRYIEVKKAGATYKACCPFHDEKTPSFVINHNKGYYHCFGCGVSGDSIKFVMEYEKIDFQSALESLAKMFNVSLDYTDSRYKPNEDYRILEKLNVFYMQNLSPSIREYIKSRGITDSLRDRFELGYAPKSHEVVKFMQDNFLNLNAVAEAKMLWRDDKNRYVAYLSERLTFPIRNENNKLVAFGGRILTNSTTQAKYKNTSNTELFNKSRILYGYNVAKDSIYKKEEIIITEGYMDTIMLHQAGFTNAVGTLGTALTKEHLPLISKGNPKVIVAYDGDRAGISAALKAANLLSLARKDGGVVIFKDGLDPADMVQGGKIKELKELFSNPIPLIEFVLVDILNKYDLQNPMQKDSCLNESISFLKQLSVVVFEEYKSWLSYRLNIPQHLIKINKPFEVLQSKIRNDSFYGIAEKCVIKSILEDESLLDLALNYLDIDMFKSQRGAYLKLLNGELEDSELIAIMCDENVIALNKKELKEQIIMIIAKHYDDKIALVKQDSTIDITTKLALLDNYQKYLKILKTGELVIYESISSI
ncbi:DNA primase [Helicobacter sp. WB40]|uniref:DNA primase n=1 Tax=Helicobacter sp. WB40 TaxID=3004130 RepID=UPI0022EBDE73|nr:DNA primase [Helicobacter sp. WB40]MDA3966605.1 DNA primase [Helicobacter sp. WB40]